MNTEQLLRSALEKILHNAPSLAAATDIANAALKGPQQIPSPEWQKGFIAGFMESGEGYNAEYPFMHDEQAVRDQLLANWKLK